MSRFRALYIVAPYSAPKVKICHILQFGFLMVAITNHNFSSRLLFFALRTTYLTKIGDVQFHHLYVSQGPSGGLGKGREVVSHVAEVFRHLFDDLDLSIDFVKVDRMSHCKIPY